MEAAQEKILMAARRYLKAEYIPTIFSSNLKTEQSYPIPDETLKIDQDCESGKYIDNRFMKKSYPLEEDKFQSRASICLESSSLRPIKEGYQTRFIFSPIFRPLIWNPPVTTGAFTLPGEEIIAEGPDFPAHLKPNNNENKIIGAGFGSEEGLKLKKRVTIEDNFALPVIPAAFTSPGKGIYVKETDFSVKYRNNEPKIQETERLTAVVLSVTENAETKQNIHYLWILEKQTDGRFFSKTRKLLPGHFFTGSFVENKPEIWDCVQYKCPIKKPAEIDRGIDGDNKIWFAVTINNFQPAGPNKRFGSATAKYFGEVIEGEQESTKLSAECNTKKVKIQQKELVEGEYVYVWMVVELL
ncbi:unnamed protein product [Caenorhabditis brenneri]